MVEREQIYDNMTHQPAILPLNSPKLGFARIQTKFGSPLKGATTRNIDNHMEPSLSGVRIVAAVDCRAGGSNFVKRTCAR